MAEFDSNNKPTFVDLSGSNVKKLPGSVYPEAVYSATSGLQRVEAFLTPSVLKMRMLAGIPMVLPITKEKVTDEMLNDYIKRAANLFEADAMVDVSPVLRRVRLPFDPNLYEQNMWMEVPYKPVQLLVSMYISSANYSNTSEQDKKYPGGAQLYIIPNDWVDMSYAQKGKIFVNPINPAFAAIGSSRAAASVGANILQFIGQQGWVPAFWTVEVVTGLCNQNGQVPLIVNEAIGMKAAILFLTNLFPLYRVGGHSLGLDGMSQSVTDNFQQLLQAKLQLLEEDYAKLVKRIKFMCGNTGFVSNV